MLIALLALSRVEGLQDPAALVERLGAEDIEVRQRAAAALVALGEAAEPALEAGARHADPELASRASHLLLDVVAPHRREVKAELSHLLAHLREAVIRRRPKDVGRLLHGLRRLDPAHPLLSNFSLDSGDWEACGVSAHALLQEIEKRGSFARAPGRRCWETEARAVREAVASTPSPGACAPCVRWRLSTQKVGLHFENVRAEDVLAYLEDVGGLRIVLVQEEEAPLFVHAWTVRVQDALLEEALEAVLAPHGAEWRVTGEGLVQVEARAPRR